MHTGVTTLQHDLDLVSTVSETWNLKLNPRKCVVMRLHRPKRPVESNRETMQYFLYGTPLAFVTSHRDLGILVDSNLKYHSHIRTIVNKAMGISYSLLRSTVCRSPDFMLTIFISHIRPLLEYCSPVWNLGYLTDLRMLESVQRRWTKQIQGVDNLNYTERLRRLGLFSIKGRLNRADLIKIWKSFHPDVDVGLSMIFERAREMGTRGHLYKLSIPLSNTDIKRR